MSKPVQPKVNVRIAPMGELNAYIVFEHELDELVKGSTATLWLNFALALLPAALGVAVTMAGSTLTEFNFLLFFCLSGLLTLVGLACLVVWWKTHKSAAESLRKIKARMPSAISLPPPIQEAPSD